MGQTGYELDKGRFSEEEAACALRIDWFTGKSQLRQSLTGKYSRQKEELAL